MAAPLLRRAGPLDDETGLHLFVLNVMLLKSLGPEYLTWDFQALREECEERWGSIGPVTWERIQAGVLLQSHNIFWEEWEVFENVTAAIMGEPPVFSLTQPPEAEECAIAIDTARRVDSHAYSDEVKSYIVAACLHDGFWFFDGTPMEMCQQQLQEYDRREGIDRRFGEVSRVLERTQGFIPDPQTAPEVQANKVREVQLALKRYNAQVQKQLKQMA